MKAAKKILGTGKRPRLCVYRSNKHIYAQIIDDIKGATLAAANSLQAGRAAKQNKSKLSRARSVGELLARKAKKLKIKDIVFDRRNYRYHGRVQALAEGARKGGLKF